MEISKEKSFLHIPYCESNNTVCSICQQIVNNEELDDHIMNHKKNNKQCQFCKSLLSVEDYALHMTICNPFYNCKYCTLQLFKDELKDHENICGSTTTACECCGEYVLTKNLINHSKYSCFPESNYKDSFKIESLISENKKSKIINDTNISMNKNTVKAKSSVQQDNYFNREKEIIYKFDNTYNETLISLYNQISITSNLKRKNNKNNQVTNNEIMNKFYKDPEKPSYMVDELYFKNQNLNTNLTPQNIQADKDKISKNKNKKKGKSKQAKEPKFFKSIQNFDKDYDYDFDEGNF